MLDTNPKLVALVTAIAVAAPVSAAHAASSRHFTQPVARATAQAPAHNIPYRHYRHFSPNRIERLTDEGWPPPRRLVKCCSVTPLTIAHSRLDETRGAVLRV